MNRLFDKLNLQPQERRLVVLVGTLVFVLLNIWFVFPHFNRWQVVSNQLESQQLKLRRYRQATNSIPKYRQELRELQSEGSKINPEMQAFRMTETIQSIAHANNVSVPRLGSPAPARSTGKTNQFYEELQVSGRVVADEPELVDFLYSLGTNSSMVRVRSLIVTPQSQNTNLEARLTLVASYQKKAPASGAAETTQTAKSTQ